MISKADQYRTKAVECDKRVAVALDADIKEQFEDLARQWREMAKQVERMFPVGHQLSCLK